MSLLLILVFLAGAIAGVFLTCIMVATDGGRDEDALIYQAGFSEGYRQGKKDSK